MRIFVPFFQPKLSVFEREVSTEKTEVRSIFSRRIRRRQKSENNKTVARIGQETQYVYKTLVKRLEDNTIMGESIRLQA